MARLIRVIDRCSRVVLRTIAAAARRARVAFDPASGVAMVTNESGWVDFAEASGYRRVIPAAT